MSLRIKEHYGILEMAYIFFASYVSKNRLNRQN